MNSRPVFVAALLWAVLVVVVVHFVDFPGSVPNFVDVSGGGTLLDASPAFTADATYERLAGFGENGRRNYFSRNLTVDLLLPLSVFPFLFLLMWRAITPWLKSGRLRATLLAVPIVYVVFDLVENAIVLMLLGQYPERLDRLATVLLFVTLIKRAASLLAIAVPLILLAIQGLRRYFHPPVPKPGMI